MSPSNCAYGVIGSCTSISTKFTSSGQTVITWKDPGNNVVGSTTLATWKGTKLVRKRGEYPESVEDGVLVCDNKTSGQFATNGFEDDVPAAANWKYKLFPYSTDGIYNTSDSNKCPVPVVKDSLISLASVDQYLITTVTYAKQRIYEDSSFKPSSTWNAYFSVKDIYGNTQKIYLNKDLSGVADATLSGDNFKIPAKHNVVIENDQVIDLHITIPSFSKSFGPISKSGPLYPSYNEGTQDFEGVPYAPVKGMEVAITGNFHPVSGAAVYMSQGLGSCNIVTDNEYGVSYSNIKETATHTFKDWQMLLCGDAKSISKVQLGWSVINYTLTFQVGLTWQTFTDFVVQVKATNI